MKFRINPDLPKEVHIPQGAVQLTAQNWLKIYDLFRFVVERNPQRVTADELQIHDSAEQMCHIPILEAQSDLPAGRQ
jgi:hypothetical protein